MEKLCVWQIEQKVPTARPGVGKVRPAEVLCPARGGYFSALQPYVSYKNVIFSSCFFKNVARWASGQNNCPPLS